MQRWHSLLSGFLMASLALVLVFFEDIYQTSSYEQEMHLRVFDRINTIRANIEAEINTHLSLVHGLAAFAKSQPDFSATDFSVFAKDLSEEQHNIRSFQLAPKGIVRFIYPIKGNEAAMGHDLLKDSKRAEAANRSIKEHKMIVVGPLNLKQGGIAVIGRHPIYVTTKNSANPKEVFWGFATVIVDVKWIFEKTGLFRKQNNFDIVLRGKDGQGENGGIFYGNEDVLSQNPILLNINIPNGTWQIAAIPKGGWPKTHPGRTLLFVGGVLFAMISSLLIYLIVRRSYELKKEIIEHEQTELALQQSKIEAEKANRSKSDFLTSMSHELRTPLNAVLGFAQILQITPHSKLTEQQNEYVDSIISGGNHLLELVNEILDLAKIESDQTALVIENVKAADVVSDCVDFSASIGHERNIKILNKFNPAESPVLVTDRQRFKQIILNILANAIKYNKDNGVVTVNGQVSDDGFLYLSISDTGIGINSDSKKRVFELFHRLESDPMHAQEGTGIGLTVTKLLVERMAGEIGVESEKGQGSTFWFKLPLASNKNILIWTDDLRIGIDILDHDHQTLFSMLNKISHKSTNDMDMEQIIENLINYTFYHFQREEHVMKLSNFPDAQLHINMHQKLAQDVQEMAQQWRSEYNSSSLLSLQKFLRNWLNDHVKKHDLALAQFIKGKEPTINHSLEKLIQQTNNDFSI